MMTSESSSGENEGWSSKSDSGSDIASSKNKRGKLLGKMRDKFRQGSRKGIHLIVYWVFATFQHYDGYSKICFNWYYKGSIVTFDKICNYVTLSKNQGCR